MLWSAASLIWILFSAETPRQALSAEEQRTWTKVRPSIVYVQNGGMTTGLAVCIDKKGYFLAHRSSTPFATLFAKLANGPQIELKQVAVDDTTQLVLLQTPTLGANLVPPVALGAEPEKAGGTLLGVLANGPVRAEFVNGEKYGVVNPSRRLVPLNELRFEANSPQIGGGLLFNSDGSLLGILGATLGTGEAQNSRLQTKSADNALGGGGVPGGLNRPAITAPRSVAPVQFGPAPQTVAYSVSSTVLHRVVAGFLSPSHRVVHPAIGVFCKDATPMGAEVTAIQPSSPAEKAGIRVGDVIYGIDQANVKNQFDVGRITMRLRIGTSVEVRLRRGGQEMAVLVSVGAG